MPADIGALLSDLRDEQAALDERVAGLTEQQWRTPSPAEGWDVADCIGHLAYFDRTAVLALTDPEAFAAHASWILTVLHSNPDVVDARAGSGADLLDAWRAGREALYERVVGADPAARVPWYGPAMSLASFVTARLMEAWAHGQDVSDALSLPAVVSERLRHVCHIGVGARAYAFAVHQVVDDGAPVRVELSGLGGGFWGPEDAADRVTGSALDFALLVTQRRHRSDVGLEIVGETADVWMSIAQAYAGPAGPGRQPLS
ncbi:MAG: hypothetical protein JWO88_1999 [Frankiales bacterium]|nr:hypothetical protein [Frankiales bacterium]